MVPSSIDAVRFIHLISRCQVYRDASSPFSGEVEVDESSFGGRRVHGKKGRGAEGRTIVFGILKRHGKGYTGIIPNAAKKLL